MGCRRVIFGHQIYIKSQQQSHPIIWPVSLMVQVGGAEAVPIRGVIMKFQLVLAQILRPAANHI